MVSEAKKRANARSDKKNSKMVSFKLNKNNDDDIIKHLENKENKNGYFKELVRKDIKENLKK